MTELRPPTLRKGTFLEPYPYRIIRQLGTTDAAGMSRLFVAEHVNKSGMALVVIKIADVRQENGKFNNTSLVREEQVLRGLHHPSIIRLLPVAPPTTQPGSVVNDDPVYSVRAERLTDQPRFLVLEYLSGGSLATRLNGEHMAIAQAFWILYRLANALEAVHAEGYVHLDLKPANVVFRDQTTAEPVLIDFGISEQIGSVQGDIVGSPPYMAPEQIRGGLPVSRAMDVWPLGILLYQMLTGKHPLLTGAHPLHEKLPLANEQEHWEIWERLANEHAPLPASDADSLRNVSTAEAEKIDQLVIEMLAVAPDERPSVDQVRSRVKRLLDQYHAGINAGAEPDVPTPRPIKTESLPPGRVGNPQWRPVAVVATVLVVALLLLAVLGREPLSRILSQASSTATSASTLAAAILVDVQEPITAVATATTTLIPTPAPPDIVPGTYHQITNADTGFTTVYLPGDNPPSTSLYMMDTEVTLEQYGACVHANRCKWPVKYELNMSFVEQNPALPVENLSAREAEEFAKWAGGRLPTAEEWIWACTSGDDSNIYPWGGSPQVDDVVPAHGVNSTPEPHVVAAYPKSKSKFNLYDMLGNVAEWTTTQDLYGLYGGSYRSQVGQEGVACKRPDPCEVDDAGYCSYESERQPSGIRIVWPWHERDTQYTAISVKPTPIPIPTVIVAEPNQSGQTSKVSIIAGGNAQQCETEDGASKGSFGQEVIIRFRLDPIQRSPQFEIQIQGRDFAEIRTGVGRQPVGPAFSTIGPGEYQFKGKIPCSSVACNSELPYQWRVRVTDEFGKERGVSDWCHFEFPK